MATTSSILSLVTKSSEQIAGIARNGSIDYSLPDFSIVLDNNSTPDITQVYAATLALSGGALTINLSSLTRTGRTALDLTNLVVHGMRVKNLGANDMTFVEGAVNGFAGVFPATNGEVIPPNGEYFKYAPGATGLGTVAAADINIDVSGTAAQTFYFWVCAGAA